MLSPNVLCILRVVWYIEIKTCVKWSLRRELKQWKILKLLSKKLVVVPLDRELFTRGFNCSDLTGKILVC